MVRTIGPLTELHLKCPHDRHRHRRKQVQSYRVHGLMNVTRPLVQKHHNWRIPPAFPSNTPVSANVGLSSGTQETQNTDMAVELMQSCKQDERPGVE